MARCDADRICLHRAGAPCHPARERQGGRSQGPVPGGAPPLRLRLQPDRSRVLLLDAAGDGGDGGAAHTVHGGARLQAGGQGHGQSGDQPARPIPSHRRAAVASHLGIGERLGHGRAGRGIAARRPQADGPGLCRGAGHQRRGPEGADAGACPQQWRQRRGARPGPVQARPVAGLRQDEHPGLEHGGRAVQLKHRPHHLRAQAVLPDRPAHDQYREDRAHTLRCARPPGAAGRALLVRPSPRQRHAPARRPHRPHRLRTGQVPHHRATAAGGAHGGSGGHG
mmetsp:Transcript_71804/g.173277  ORF Transcript_71804/g.173277 Transcript_71804/m.173277 type:complete len:281 (+) Transcript_71804:776-1618(+)